MLRTISAAALALLLLLCRTCPAAAEQLLEDIRFEAVSPNQEQVAFRLSGSAVMPKFFTMKEGSPRLVFDFDGTGIGRRISKSIEAGGSLIERIRVGVHGTKIRVVLDLRPGRKIGMQQEADTAKKTLTVIVHDARVAPRRQQEAKEKPAAAPPVKPVEKERNPVEKPAEPPPAQTEKKQPEEPAAAPPASRSSASTVLSSVLFEKNSNRGEMVMFRLNKFHPPVVFGLEEQKPRVVCDFKDTAAGERLPESIAADGKYVRGISISRDEAGSKIRAVLDLAPNYSYDLQQVFFKNDNLFVLIINPLGSLNRN